MAPPRSRRSGGHDDRFDHRADQRAPRLSRRRAGVDRPAGGRAWRRADRRRRRRRPSTLAARRPPRRALRATTAAARPQRGAQQRPRGDRRRLLASSTTTSRRSRAGSRRCSRRRLPTPASSPAGSASASRAGAARLRARGRADHVPRPRDTDRDADRAYGACMAIRRAALDAHGRFRRGLARRAPATKSSGRRRFVAAGGRVRYVAGAVVDHRRGGDDARLRALARAARRAAAAPAASTSPRRAPPSLARELACSPAASGTPPRFRCPMSSCGAPPPPAALREAGRRARRRAGAAPAASPTSSPAPAGPSAAPTALRRAHRRPRVRRASASGRRAPPAARAARGTPRGACSSSAPRPRRADACGRRAGPLAPRRRARPAAEPAAGKFENLNALLADHAGRGSTGCWSSTTTSSLPARFLDRFLFLARALRAAARPAGAPLRSHAAWPVTRRRRGARSRDDELRRDRAGDRVPQRRRSPSCCRSPALRMGWGLDPTGPRSPRARLADRHRRRDCRSRHPLGPPASGYSREQAIAEARAFLAARPYLRRDEVRTLATHRRW